MFIVRMEHAVPVYDQWKIAFDSGPVGRQKAGVLRYSVYRSTMTVSQKRKHYLIRSRRMGRRLQEK